MSTHEANRYHAKHSRSITTRCLKPTPIEKLYLLARVSSHDIRRRIAIVIGGRVLIFLLKSRKSILNNYTKKLKNIPQEARVILWNKEI